MTLWVLESGLTPDVQADVVFSWEADSLFPSASPQPACWGRGLPAPPQRVDLGLAGQQLT